MAKKFAETSEEKKAALHRRISQIGQSLGINFKWGGKIGWTREAHRLVYLSRSQPAEVQDKLLEGIFSAYHEQEKDIASVDTLRQIAVDAGIDDEEVDGWLTSNEGLDEMLAEVQEFRTIREKTGVPAYRIQNAYMLEGSQDLQDWMEIFIKIRENEPSQS
jgi:predicted DsbA family dithiol-disulfide isomerase